MSIKIKCAPFFDTITVSEKEHFIFKSQGKDTLTEIELNYYQPSDTGNYN